MLYGLSALAGRHFQLLFLFQLALRTVNSSRSAYACFLFAPSFFLNYDDGAGLGTSDAASGADDTGLRCKVGAKV